MPEDLKDIEKSILEAQKAGTEHAERTEPEQAPADADAPMSADGEKVTALLAEKQAEIDRLRLQVAQRNTEFSKELADLKEREAEFAQTLAELRDAADPPATQLSQDTSMKHEELVKTPEYADYLILRIAAERRDRETPGYSKNLFARIAAEEKQAGLLVGQPIREVKG